jgi:hypothetical protein
MKIFLKLLPYLIIIALGFGIYGGFKYMSDEVSKAKEQVQTLLIQKSELENKVDTLNTIKDISIEQQVQLQHNEKESIKYINDFNNKINELTFNEDKDIILMKINNYEVCMAKNSLNPEIKCELNLK